MVRIEIDYEALGEDKTALEMCPAGVYEEEDGKIVAAHPENCMRCHACTTSAPEGAITLIEE